MTTRPEPEETSDRMAEAARRTAERAREGEEDREPSLGARLGQIGILGWAIVVPTLIGLLLGRWLDGVAGTGIQFSAAFIMVGAVIGFWTAWKWMHGN